MTTKTIKKESVQENFLSAKTLHKGNIFEAWNLNTGEYIGADTQQEMLNALKIDEMQDDTFVFLYNGEITSTRFFTNGKSYTILH